MCDCISLTNKALAEHNLTLDVLMFIDSNQVKIPIHTELKETRRGQKPIRISANYCPMCGEKYAESEKK